MRYTITYDEVRAQAQRRQRCTICGKWSKRQRTFVETISPFNQDEDGNVKTPEQVRRSVNEKAVGWRPEPEFFDHEACKS